MRKRRFSLLLAAKLLVAASMVTTASVATADTTAPDTGVAIFPTIFNDASGAATLAVQIQPNRADSGQFNFYIAGLGDYTGVVPVDQTGGVEHLKGTVAAQLLPAGGGGGTASTVKMEGVIDPVGLTANINVWADGTHYHLKTDQRSAGDAAKVAAQALAAIKAEDWTTLYGLLASGLRAQYTQDQFVQTMSSQAAQGPTPINAATTGAGQIVVSPYGYTYYQVPVSIQGRAADGSTTTITPTLYVLLDQGAWHFWLTDDPSAP